MFVRFRLTKTRLQASLIETRRVGGKVRHEHVASLGTIEASPTTLDRIEFWPALHQRLAKLSNRIDAETHHKILAQIHARIPMVTADEQRQLQCEVAEADAHFYSSIHDMTASNLDDLKQLAAESARAVSDREADLAQSAVRAADAKERLAKIRNGEDVPGLLRNPMTRDELFKALGLTKSDVQHINRVVLIGEIGALDEVVDEWVKRNEKARKDASRAVLKRRKLDQPD
jgi:hypothetical protein